jgi:hypothetical protein
MAERGTAPPSYFYRRFESGTCETREPSRIFLSETEKLPGNCRIRSFFSEKRAKNIVTVILKPNSVPMHSNLSEVVPWFVVPLAVHPRDTESA